MPTQLFDSEGEIEQLQIVMLCRDNAKYLQTALPLLEGLGNYYAARLHFLFIENDSRDATPALLKSFVQRHSGLVLHPNLPKDFSNRSRTSRLAELRNQIHQRVNPNTRWIVLVDTNIYFDLSILKKIVQLLRRYPEAGLIGAHGLEVIPRGTLRAFRKSFKQSFESIQIESGLRFLTQNHYYDTYAYRSLSGINLWPACDFTSCRRCNDTTPVNPYQEDIRWVTSCFGGLALVRSELLQVYQAKWNGVSQLGEDQCEHVGLCEDILKLSPYKVGVAVNTPVYWVAG